LLRPVAGDDEAGREHVFARAGEPERREAGKLHRRGGGVEIVHFRHGDAGGGRAAGRDPHGIAELIAVDNVVSAAASFEPSARGNGIAARNAGRLALVPQSSLLNSGVVPPTGIRSIRGSLNGPATP
jgi:hypothetical protein